jgi:hypothetical protein
MVVCILKFQMWFDVNVLDFQIKLYCRHVDILWPKIGRNLNPFSGHTGPLVYSVSYERRNAYEIVTWWGSRNCLSRNPWLKSFVIKSEKNVFKFIIGTPEK